MATLTSTARLLRLDADTWRNLASTGSFAGAALVAIGAYALLAFDRFGVQGVTDPRATVRLLLVGFYGWLWLGGAAWLIARFALPSGAAFPVVLRLYGNAHLPIVIVGIAIQIFAIVAQMLGPALVVAGFAFAFWMPAMLVGATRELFGLDTRRAVIVIGGPYLVWVVIVGRWLTTQLGHLL